MGDAFKCDVCGNYVDGKGESYHYVDLGGDVKTSVSFTFNKLKGDYGLGKTGEMCGKCLGEKMLELGRKLVHDNSMKELQKSLGAVDKADKKARESEIVVGKIDTSDEDMIVRS